MEIISNFVDWKIIEENYDNYFYEIQILNRCNKCEI